MIWQDELCAICTCAILIAMLLGLAAWACARAIADARVRCTRIEFGLPEDGWEDDGR